MARRDKAHSHLTERSVTVSKVTMELSSMSTPPTNSEGPPGMVMGCLGREALRKYVLMSVFTEQ